MKRLSNIDKFNIFYYPDLTVEVENLEDFDLTRYDNRIKRTFELGKEMGYDAVTTSLLVSPHLDHEEILMIGHKYSALYQIPFYDEDFRVGYVKGRNRAKRLGLYCQK